MVSFHPLQLEKKRYHAIVNQFTLSDFFRGWAANGIWKK